MKNKLFNKLLSAITILIIQLNTNVMAQNISKFKRRKRSQNFQ
jgi:hypothetical protein